MCLFVVTCVVMLFGFVVNFEVWEYWYECVEVIGIDIGYVSLYRDWETDRKSVV